MKKLAMKAKTESGSTALSELTMEEPGQAALDSATAALEHEKQQEMAAPVAVQSAQDLKAGEETPEEIMAKLPDLSDVVKPGVVAEVHVAHFYIDHAISGRLYGRDPKKFKELKDSILHNYTDDKKNADRKDNGQIEPVGVGLTEEGKAILYSGFGRWQAIFELYNEGLHSGLVKTILWNVSVTEGYVGGAESNIKREELNPIQTAGLIATLMAPPFNYKAPEVSKRLSIATGYVNGFRKLRAFPDDVQAAIGEGTIGVTAALDLSRLPVEEGTKLARKFMDKAKALAAVGRPSKVDPKEVRQETRALGRVGIRSVKEIRDGMMSLHGNKAVVEGGWGQVFLALDYYIAGKVDLKDIVKVVQTGTFEPPVEQKRKFNRVAPLKGAKKVAKPAKDATAQAAPDKAKKTKKTGKKTGKKAA